MKASFAVTVARRDMLLALGLLGLMLLTVLLSARQDAGGASPPALSSYSPAPDGARALALWLEALGYSVGRIEGTSFRLDPGGRDACLLFVLSPQGTFSRGEVERVDNWVEAGGTLILASERWIADSLLEHFDLDISFLDERVEEADVAQPLLLDPPWTRARVRAERYLVTARDDVVVHLTANGEPVLLSFEHGAGRVFVAATAFPFTNAGLRDQGNARLVHNLVAAAPAGGLPVGAAGAGARVVFDEFHHGYQTARTLYTWLQTTAQGRSLIYVGLVVFLYLLIGGRRFGRPLPLPRGAARRAPVEHIQAMANLFRRGGKRVAILRHYHGRLKRELAHPHHLDPTLNDVDFIAQLGAIWPDLDRAALSRLLQETSQERVSEGELIRLAQEVDYWTRRKD
jgi:hypothetical protein